MVVKFAIIAIKGMKLISLNIWGGRHDKLKGFLERHTDVDFFLLQEVIRHGSGKTNFDGLAKNEIFSEIEKILDNHTGYFAPTQDEEWGLAIYSRKSIVVQEAGDIFVHRFKDAMEGNDGRTLGRNLQYLKVTSNTETLNLLNFHGLWDGKNKSDNLERLSQSKMIIEFTKKLTGETILAGDFNLRPDTESMEMIERQLNFMNLIPAHGITSTRPPIYTGPERHADHMLVSKSVQVIEFKVLEDEVSDHLPLYLEFT
jgi:endonuclease/exonuclease/phosphatase family metal-dependent hydrolase